MDAEILAYTLTRLDELDPALDVNGRRERFDERYAGLDWPFEAETMVGVPRLLHIAEWLERSMADGVSGGFCECGVWRGGSSIMAAAVLKGSGRPVWVCDSFRGFPPPDERYSPDRQSMLHTNAYLTVGLEEVKANFAKYGLLSDQVRFVEGYFADSLPGPVGELCYLRCDGDMYGSTYNTLDALYDHVEPGGIVMVDDWNIGGQYPPAQAAVRAFREEQHITEPIVDMGPDCCCAVYWQKGS